MFFNSKGYSIQVVLESREIGIYSVQAFVNANVTVTLQDFKNLTVSFIDGPLLIYYQSDICKLGKMSNIEY